MASPAREGFFDGMLGRLAANVLGMAGVAFCTLWVVEQRNHAEQEEAKALHAEVETARFERDRMTRLNHELARELHEADVAAEVARWQLRYTEERLRRTEAESRSAALTEVRRGWDLRRKETNEPGGTPASLPRRASIEPLDPLAEAHLEEAAQARAEGSNRPSTDTALEQAGVALDEGSALDLDPMAPVEIDALASAGVSGRSAALLEWRAVVSETLDAECGTRSGARTHACRTALERQLFPYSERAVRCLTSGNAEPDYVFVADVERLPSHSVPLERGALILCDGALEHL